jgi:hypothetical protein
MFDRGESPPGMRVNGVVVLDGERLQPGVSSDLALLTGFEDDMPDYAAVAVSRQTPEARLDIPGRFVINLPPRAAGPSRRTGRVGSAILRAVHCLLIGF